MASARKKQDEKNLKNLRELVSLPGNKHCFDCNQRGPTYVNMTIGSFVCTKCSGMLRGLTPPHRVKSISMASFTTEEVDFVKSKGNDHCRQTWLALYDQNINAETKDEQQIKDFMIDKYERKRYYHDKGLRNGTLSPPIAQKTTFTEAKTTFPSPIINGTQKNGFSLNGNHSDNTSKNSNDFVADFSTANFISTPQFNNNSSTTSQPSFANFDNNVIFNSANVISPPIVNGSLGVTSPINKVQAPPSEDRYAALKDLDNALKTQQIHQENHQQPLEWSTAASSNGSGYTSPLYGSPSTTGGSMYGSPSQGNFATAFAQQDLPNISNPFNVAASPSPRNPWLPNGNSGTPPSNTNNTVIANNCFSSYNNGIANVGHNPFKTDTGCLYGGTKFNGVSNGNGFGNNNGYQNMFGNSSHFVNKSNWAAPNPFSLGVSPGAGGNSNNPFL